MDARTRLQESIAVALIVSDLPATYRRALLQQELATLPAAEQNAFLDRALGGCGPDDPLVALMHGGA